MSTRARVTPEEARLLLREQAHEEAMDILAGREPAVWDTERFCVECGIAVEVERRSYAVPTCYGCLPPPPPLDRVQRKADISELTNNQGDDA